MKSSGKIFRIQGILVFIVLAGLIGGFFILFLDGIIKDTIEDQGSRILKSQIDIASLSTSLLSQSMDIGNLEIPNADNLNENLVQAGRIKFDFDGGKAFSKKVIIDDMRLENLLFDQKRKTPAEPYQRPDSGKKETGKTGEKSTFDGLGLAGGLQFKSPKDILKEEKLETLEAVEKIRNDAEKLKIKWQTQIDQQLSKEELTRFQQRIKELKAKGKNLKDPVAIQSFTGEIQALRKDIQSHLDTIKNFKKSLEADVRKAKALVVNVKNLPKKDFDRLKKKYSLDLKGGTGLAGQMVSGSLKTKIDKAWRYYKRISPYLKSGSEYEPEPEKKERGKGQFIKFPSPQPFPDFLIRNAKLSMNVRGQEVAGDFQGLTNDPKVYGKPFNLNLAGGQNEAFKQFSLKLVLDRTRAEAGDSLETEVDSFKIEPVPFGNWATLTQGLVDFKGSIEIRNEKEMNGTLSFKVHNAAFAQAGEAKDEIARLLGKVLASVNRFYLQVAIKGTPDQYTLQIKSDLDQILARSVRKLFDEKAREFEGKLRQSIAEATQGPLSEAGDWVPGLTGHRKDLNSQESAYQNLLSQATEKALLGKIPGGDSLLKKFKLPF